MSTVCDHCGYKSSDVRPGGGISEKGAEIKLKVQELPDLRRDVIKSETASVQIPELQFEILEGSLGSLITTVEGVLARVKDELGRCCSLQLMLLHSILYCSSESTFVLGAGQFNMCFLGSDSSPGCIASSLGIQLMR